MKILVTGGLGTIGRGLVAELRSRGHDVVSCDLCHQPDQLGFRTGSDVPTPRYVRCDVGCYRELQQLFDHRPVDLMYHTAAEFGRWNGEDYYERLWQTGAIGMRNILRLQESRHFRLVHLSTSEVYGDWGGVMAEQVMDEQPIRQLNDYAISKWANELQIRNSIAQYDTRTVVVRLFNTYGPGEYYSPYRSAICRFVYCALRGLPWTVHRGHERTSTYIDDTVRTLANIADRFQPGEVYNVGGGEPHTNEHVSDCVVAATNADPSLVQYKDSEPHTTKKKIVDTDRAKRDLDHRITVSLEEGIRRTVEWMRRTYVPGKG